MIDESFVIAPLLDRDSLINGICDHRISLANLAQKMHTFRDFALARYLGRCTRPANKKRRFSVRFES